MNTVNVERGNNWYFFNFPEEPLFYFLDMTKLHRPKVLKADGNGNIYENDEIEKLQLDAILMVFTEIKHLNHKAIGWGMCQLIESWGDEDKTQNARKCMMWKELERVV